MARQEESSLKGSGDLGCWYYLVNGSWHRIGTGPYFDINPVDDRSFEWDIFAADEPDCIPDESRRPVDPVNHPSHYTSHPSGIECIQITEHMGFCIGNAIKYLWRVDSKDNPIQDLEKAIFYINREIELRKGGQ